MAFTGYAALGNSVPSIILHGFPQAPAWVLVTANMAIVIHMASAFQARRNGAGPRCIGGRGTCKQAPPEAGTRPRHAPAPRRPPVPACLHAASDLQVFAQPMFDLMESWIKAWHIRKERKRAGAGAGAAAGAASAVRKQPAFEPIAEEASGGSGAMGSKAPSAQPSQLSPFQSVDAEAAVAGGDVVMLQDVGRLGRRQMSVRMSEGGLVARNSAPIPDLLPLRGEGLRACCLLACSAGVAWRTLQLSAAARLLPPSCCGNATERQRHHRPPASLPCPAGYDQQATLSRRHGLSTKASTQWSMGRLASVLGSRASMYVVTAGAANEHVPLNETGFFLPFWQVRCGGAGGPAGRSLGGARAGRKTGGRARPQPRSCGCPRCCLIARTCCRTAYVAAPRCGLLPVPVALSRVCSASSCGRPLSAPSRCSRAACPSF